MTPDQKTCPGGFWCRENFPLRFDDLADEYGIYKVETVGVLGLRNSQLWSPKLACPLYDLF